MKKTINIVCAADDRYAPMCGIMLTSLFENNRDCHVEVYVLTSGFGKKNERLMSQLVEHGKYDGCVHIEKVDDKLFEGCPTIGYLTIATYYRFMAADLLPQDMEKVINLDCDLLINGSLLPLFETDIDGVAMAACEEPYNQDALTYWKRLGYPEEYGYCNTGVTLINLTYWREHNVRERLFRYVAEDPSRLQYPDQDALNGVLYKEKKSLPAKYDVYVAWMSRSVFNQDIKDYLLKERPVILHYIGDKPWDWFLPDYPFRPQWEAAKKKSLWKRWDGAKPWKVKMRRKVMMAVKCLIGKAPKIYVDDWKVWSEYYKNN